MDKNFGAKDGDAYAKIGRNRLMSGVVISQTMMFLADWPVGFLCHIRIHDRVPAMSVVAQFDAVLPIICLVH